MSVTRCSVKRTDNETLVMWSRIASVSECRAVFTAEIIERLIKEHIEKHGNEPPKPNDASPK